VGQGSPGWERGFISAGVSALFRRRTRREVEAGIPFAKAISRKVLKQQPTG